MKTKEAVPDAFAEPVALDDPTHEQAVQMSADINAVFAAMSDEDLDIPADLLTGAGSTAPASPVYRWEIPLDSNRGYLLPIEITDAASIEHARNAALCIVLGATEIEKGRNLTAVEQAWIKATEPTVVRDTESITLDHDAALRDNARLKAESDLYASAKRILADHGIGPSDPQAWADAQMSGAAAHAKANADEQDARRQLLVSKLVSLQHELAAAIEETDFAPAKPQPAAEPDYSILTVVVKDASEAERYPRLAGANFITHDPAEPLTADEVKGLEMLTADGHGLIEREWRKFPTPDEDRALKAIQSRIKAEFA